MHACAKCFCVDAGSLHLCIGASVPFLFYPVLFDVWADCWRWWEAPLHSQQHLLHRASANSHYSTAPCTRQDEPLICDWLQGERCSCWRGSSASMVCMFSREKQKINNCQIGFSCGSCSSDSDSREVDVDLTKRSARKILGSMKKSC